MVKKTVVMILLVVGAAAAIFTALSGVLTLLVGGPGSGGGDLTVTWFAPLFLAPLGVAGSLGILIASLVSKHRRALTSWAVAALVILLALIAAVFQFSGLAQGDIEPTESIWGTVAVTLCYVQVVGLLGIGALGVALMRDVLATHETHARASLAP